MAERDRRRDDRRQFGGQQPAAQWTEREGRPAEIANDLDDPVPMSGGVGTTGDPRQSAGTLANRDAAAPGDVGIGGDDMFGENTAAAGAGDTGDMNLNAGGTDQAGSGTTSGVMRDRPGVPTAGVGDAPRPKRRSERKA